MLIKLLRNYKPSVYAGLRGIEIGENIDFYCFNKIKMNSLIQIFFYYNISFFNVNRKIKFHSDFTLFCIIIHYLKRYSIIAAVTLSLSFIDIMFDIITFLSSPDVNNL